MGNFFKEAWNIAKTPFEAVFGDIGGNADEQHRNVVNQHQCSMWNALKSGQQEGRQKAQELYGTSYGDVGQMAKDVTKQTQKATSQYSAAGDLIKQKGNQQAKIAKLRGGKMGAGTQGEQAQMAQNMSTMTASNRFAQQQQSMDNYRSLVGNLARNMATAEMGQGQLNLSAIRPLTQFDMQQENKGILGSLFG